MNKIEAVELAVVKWQKRVRGESEGDECPLCMYSRVKIKWPSTCEKCPMLSRWPLAVDCNMPKCTTRYCTDMDSAWSKNDLDNDKLVLNALEKLLKELKREEKHNVRQKC